MKRILNLLQQNLLLASRNGHLLITGILLALMLALVLFLPREVRMHNELVLDATPDGALAAYLQARGAAEGAVYRDKAAFREALARQPNKVGVIYSGGLDAPAFEIITQGAVAEENLRLLEVALDRAILEMRGVAQDGLRLETLRPPSEPVPFNLSLIPILLVFEVVLLGFFIAAVMVFQEKRDATLRAYRVTPSGAPHYVLATTLLFVLLSLAYGLPILLVGMGLGANYGLMLTLIVLSSALMTMFGMTTAVYYRDLSEWMVVGMLILILNSLPMLSYAMPSFAPAWLTWMPSYHTVFAARDVLFHGAGWGDVAPTLLYLLALNLVAYAAAHLSVRFRLLKEVH